MVNVKIYERPTKYLVANQLYHECFTNTLHEIFEFYFEEALNGIEHEKIVELLKSIFTSHIDKKISLTFFLTSLSLYIFTASLIFVSADGIYFDKILV
jgi:hypothetical protein